MGKFIIKKTQTGFVFRLLAENGETILTSEVYAALASAKEGMASVKHNAPIAGLEDQTQPDFKTCTNPKFEVYIDKANEFRFRLKARNGEIIGVSEGYKSKESCLNGIDSVRANAPDAEMEIAE